MDFLRTTLDAAHHHSTNHRTDLERSDVCGCFFCAKTFAVSDVEEWVEDESGTALCPNCGIDSVIGSASGFPVADPNFLRAMHDVWFR
ncbi:cytoplasmic protein [Sphingomonas sp. ABOLD]|uniref:cytoplasmic protein n=1 Tax=Sphingomonas TaxID=13687 RepID=UPI000F7E8774|nr:MULTISPECIES: cytoplasmic protein [Sphingomonas]RSV36203.1 cytoplasmic protein [Sphingomonas sp. ABOLD]RSV37985.1 cytoplasmic protein [Sphingomonas sp. ABOLE]